MRLATRKLMYSGVMRVAVTLLALVVLGACSHATIDASSRSSAAGVVPSAGSTVTSGQAGLHVQSSALAAVVVTGMVIAAVIDDARQERSFPSFSASFGDWLRGPQAPALAPDRSISEQDCTRPLDYSLGNIRCK
jgi:hypothetical protein